MQSTHQRYQISLSMNPFQSSDYSLLHSKVFNILLQIILKFRKNFNIKNEYSFYV